MRLLSLETENVKRTKLVRFKPRKGVNVVRGKNKNGKTSLLDSVEYLFGGTKTHPPRVIREGENEAHVVAETEEFIALRRWWKGTDGSEKTELELRAKEGGKLKSPQAILDKLFSGTFSATAFQELPPPKQLEVLRRLTGVDTTELDASFKRLYDARTGINTELKAARARLAGIGIDEAPPPKPDIAALLKRQEQIAGAQRRELQVRAEREAAARRVKDCEEAVKVAEQALAQARTRLEIAQKQHGEADNAVDELPPAGELAAELETLKAAISEASNVVVLHERWATRGKLEKEVADLDAKSLAHTQQLEGLEAKKTAMISAAKFPVTGLGFSETGVTFGGLPLEQASGAELLAVSVAIGIALNPKLKVMLVRNGSFLDEDSLAMLESLCEQYDMQCFVEMVGKDGPAAIVIVDGEVLSRSES